ncbi:TPA: phage tail protein, partial [Escherichia coli]|nr:phage tail protein [Escherichia coli]
LTRAARHRGVLVTSNAAGELVFTQAGSQRGDTLTLGENLLDLDHNVDHRLRHSEYRVRGHGRGGGHAGDALTAGTLAAPVGMVTDSAIHRYRPKIVLADHAVDADGARQRAVREMRRAVARSVRLTATVRHWFRENGQLWDINLLTAVTAPRTGVEERDLLVCQVEFSLDANHGETTRLILAPRDGFIVPAEPGNSGSGNAGDVDAFVRAQMKKQGIKFNDE